MVSQWIANPSKVSKPCAGSIPACSANSRREGNCTLHTPQVTTVNKVSGATNFWLKARLFTELAIKRKLLRARVKEEPHFGEIFLYEPLA